jgi:hypothetical protein
MPSLGLEIDMEWPKYGRLLVANHYEIYNYRTKPLLIIA